MRSIALFAGPAAGALLAAGAGLAVTDGFLTDGETLARSFAGDGDRVLGGAQLGVLGAAALLWFSASLVPVVRRREAPDGAVGGGVFATAAAAGGVAAATLWLAAFVGLAAGALRADEDGSIPAGSAQLVYDLSVVLGGAAAPVAAAVLVAAVAAASLRAGSTLLPRWLALVSAALAIALLALPVNYAATPVFLVWLVIAGPLLARTD